MSLFKRGFLGVVLSVLLCGAAFGSGFAIYEWSSIGDAMGGAVIAGGDGAEVLSSNPAAITRVENSDWDIGVSWINPRGQVRFRDDGSVQMNEKDPAFVPHAYYVKKISSNSWFGFGSYSRFGLSSKFAPDWKGRFDSYYTSVESVSLVPTYAVKVNDSLSLALGMEVMYLDFENKRAFMTPAGETNADIHADDWSWGWNLGLLWDVTDRTSLGMVYRSRVKQSVEGSMKIAGVADMPAWGDVTLPDSLSFGVSHKFNDRTRVEFDAIHTWWSTYDKLVINNSMGQIAADKDWNNVWRYQLGVDHRISDRWSLLAGFVYDQSPIPDGKADFMVPANDRKIYSIGTRYENKDLTVVLSYAWLTMDGREVDYVQSDGSHSKADLEELDSDIIGLTFNWRL